MGRMSGDNRHMKQTDLSLDLSNHRTCKRVLLDEIGRAVPWDELLALIACERPWSMRRDVGNNACAPMPNLAP